MGNHTKVDLLISRQIIDDGIQQHTVLHTVIPQQWHISSIIYCNVFVYLTPPLPLPQMLFSLHQLNPFYLLNHVPKVPPKKFIYRMENIFSFPVISFSSQQSNFSVVRSLVAGIVIDNLFFVPTTSIVSYHKPKAFPWPDTMISARQKRVWRVALFCVFRSCIRKFFFTVPLHACQYPFFQTVLRRHHQNTLQRPRQTPSVDVSLCLLLKFTE